MTDMVGVADSWAAARSTVSARATDTIVPETNHLLEFISILRMRMCIR